MLNKVMIIGRLGQDPKLNYTQNGTAVCNMSIATDESYQDKEGNKVQRTEWHSAVIYQRQAENCSKFLAKGSLIYLEGTLLTRKWQDQQGQDRYKTEIKALRVQFLDRREKEQQPDLQQDNQDQRQTQAQAQNGNQARSQTANRNQVAQQQRLPSNTRQVNYGEYQGTEYCDGIDDVPF